MEEMEEMEKSQADAARTVLTDAEFRDLFQAVCSSAGEPIGLTEAALVVRWCDEVLQLAEVVAGVLRGDIKARWPGGASCPTFSLTASGRERLAELEQLVAALQRADL